MIVANANQHRSNNLSLRSLGESKRHNISLAKQMPSENLSFGNKRGALRRFLFPEKLEYGENPWAKIGEAASRVSLTLNTVGLGTMLYPELMGVGAQNPFVAGFFTSLIATGCFALFRKVKKTL